MASSLAATIVIPTHNHGSLVKHAVRSALDQTVADLEVFVMGDGMTPETRAVVETLLREDPRVRLFDHPKGPRLGETYRHAALAEARGEIVTYLGDDDLYLPGHVAAMRAALEHADFAGSLNVMIMPDGRIKLRLTVDLTHPEGRARVVSNVGESVSLSRIGHRLEAYRRLPYGWRTTPEGIPTDRWMVMQWAEQKDARLANSTRPTVLRFPSGARNSWSLARREEESIAWFAKSRDPKWRASFEDYVRDLQARRLYQRFLNVHALRERLAKQKRKKHKKRK